MERLTRRTDFRAASRGTRASASAFVLQARRRPEHGPVRVGFTVSKQVGNAVERNRVRRRLREMVRLSPDDAMRDGHDYVLIGRRAALALPFSEMKRELDTALRRIHRPEAAPETAPGGGPGTGAAGKRPLHEAGPRRPKPQRHPGEA